MKKLSTILKGVDYISPAPNRFDAEKIFIKGIETDSRRLKEGYLFVALEGAHRRGADFIIDAFADKKAAAAIIPRSAEEVISNLPSGLDDVKSRIIVVEDSAVALGAISRNFYNNPTSDIILVGVTGTNGKTTFTYLMEAILKEYLNKSGRSDDKVGVIGTINYRYGDKVVPSVNTTPFAHKLMEIFSGMRREGVAAAVMEVSSHSLAQHRVDGCEFDICVFTNLTQDHLDYHQTMENYYNAKKRLFTELLERSGKKNKSHIVNLDDEWGIRLSREKINSSRLVTFSINPDVTEASARVLSYKMSCRGMKLLCSVMGKEYEFETHLIGRYNISNVVASVAAAYSLGIPFSVVKNGLLSVKRIPGRLETIHSRKKGFSVVVDYAHTPDALEKVMGVLRELKPARLITVFGCGGDRDRTKRPVMGQLAVKHSDYVILTSDNPRTEDPHKILLDIEIGIKKIGAENYTIISDREKAVEAAISMASEGDIILLAGKGHEDYQIIGDEKIHFSDYEVAKKFLDVRNKNP